MFFSCFRLLCARRHSFTFQHGPGLIKAMSWCDALCGWHEDVGDGPICQWLGALVYGEKALRGRKVSEETAHRQKYLYPHRKSQVLNWTHTQDTEKGKAYTLNNQKSIIYQHQFVKNLSQCLETLRSQLKGFLFYLEFYQCLHVRFLQFS